MFLAVPKSTSKRQSEPSQLAGRVWQGKSLAGGHGVIIRLRVPLQEFTLFARTHIILKDLGFDERVKVVRWQEADQASNKEDFEEAVARCRCVVLLPRVIRQRESKSERQEETAREKKISLTPRFSHLLTHFSYRPSPLCVSLTSHSRKSERGFQKARLRIVSWRQMGTLCRNRYILLHHVRDWDRSCLSVSFSFLPPSFLFLCVLLVFSRLGSVWGVRDKNT